MIATGHHILVGGLEHILKLIVGMPAESEATLQALEMHALCG